MMIVNAIKSVIVIVPVMNSSIIVPLSYNVFSMKAKNIAESVYIILVVDGLISL